MKRNFSADNLIAGCNSTAMTDTTPTTIIAAQGANARVYIGTIVISNKSTGLETEVTISGLDDGPITVNAYPGSGFTVPLLFPLRGNANTAIVATCLSNGASVRVIIAGLVDHL